MNCSLVVHAQEIFHDTGSVCNHENMEVNAGGWYADQNQGPFSIHKKESWGDDMVVAWIVLDELDEKVVMDVIPKTHKMYDPTQRWNMTEYYKAWEYFETEQISNGEMDGHMKRLHVHPGDIVLFQGLVFHRVIKSSKCKYGECRRITIRYLNADITTWRNDVGPSVWPFISQLAQPGKLIRKKKFQKFRVH